jgi:hypothetical protein
LKIPFAFCLLLLTGCGALSTQQSPKLLDPGQKVWIAGLGAGRLASCVSDTSGQVAFGNGCVLTLDPYFGYRFGTGAGEAGPADPDGQEGSAEAGVKFSGIPFLGGTILGDIRYQKWIDPVFLSYDFGVFVFPCAGAIWDHEDDLPEEADQDKKHDCGDTPFGGGGYAGVTFGKDWLYAGLKYGIGGNTWDGLQLLPGARIGSSLGPRRFKITPSVDAYFYQWPLDFTPELRVIYGLGFQVAY